MTAASLTAWRARLGFSKTRAAHELGCSRQSITTWENGTYPVPKFISLACAAIALGLEEETLKWT